VSDQRRLSRRSFLGGAAGVTAGLAAGAAGVTALGTGAAGAATNDSGARLPRYVPFHGAHQTGIVSPAPAAGLMASFTVAATDRTELSEMFQVLTEESARIMEGKRYDDRDSAYPALYTGTVGNPPPAADLSVITSVGASLFDERFGIADRRPRELVEMPFLANDRLDPRSATVMSSSRSRPTPRMCACSRSAS
jgi:deferrochelatase/peroxidase EfeB